MSQNDSVRTKKGEKLIYGCPQKRCSFHKKHLQKQQGTRMILQDWDEPRPGPCDSTASLSPFSLFSGKGDPPSQTLGLLGAHRRSRMPPHSTFLWASLLLSHHPSDPKANSSLMYLKILADHISEKQSTRAFSISLGKHSPAHCSSPTTQVSEILTTKTHFSLIALCKNISLLQLIFCTPRQRSLQFSNFQTQTHHFIKPS